MKKKQIKEKITYGDVDDWDIDYDREEAVLYKDGEEVDRIDLTSLIQDWLEERKHVEFTPVSLEE